MIRLKHILVATDFSDVSDAALLYATALAKTFDADMHVLHVTENLFLRAVASDPSSVVTAAGRSLDDKLSDEHFRDVRIRPVVETSDEPADAIVSYAKLHPIDLIVMGTHGRTGAARVFIGSVAERVVRLAPCPVLTVRHPEREFVVDEVISTTTEASPRSEPVPRPRSV